MAHVPISIDDPEKDEATIRIRLTDELKRQREAENNGQPTEFNFT
jgi:hypothetical protein